MSIRHFKYVLPLIAILFLWSCGDVSAPPGSTITINPPSLSIENGDATARWTTQFYTVSVIDKDGYPVGDAELSISFIWASPNPYNLVQLYKGTTPVDSPFSATTDEFGAYTFRLDFISGGSYEYTGDIEVRSGAAFASSTLDVTVATTTTP
ncbi:hypothetical protein MNBD_NITROSPIRAE02-622 [hydrothermal vent metagenome]|uniref:YtkA-like domain-containing protein n=1 Tax=hydrothermal vent metagenome TaxID=652676 RepID=A0A3B1D3P3_9ZZZZ